MSWEENKEEISLKYPVKWGQDGRVEKLSFRPLLAKDLMNLKVSADGQMSFGDMLKIAGDIVEHESGSAIINQLHASDAIQVVGLVGSFLEDSQGIGNF